MPVGRAGYISLTKQLVAVQYVLILNSHVVPVVRAIYNYMWNPFMIQAASWLEVYQSAKNTQCVEQWSYMMPHINAGYE